MILSGPWLTLTFLGFYFSHCLRNEHKVVSYSSKELLFCSWVPGRMDSHAMSCTRDCIGLLDSGASATLWRRLCLGPGLSCSRSWTDGHCVPPAPVSGDLVQGSALSMTSLSNVHPSSELYAWDPRGPIPHGGHYLLRPLRSPSSLPSPGTETSKY